VVVGIVAVVLIIVVVVVLVVVVRRRRRRSRPSRFTQRCFVSAGPILSVFSALIVHSELKSMQNGFPVAFIF